VVVADKKIVYMLELRSTKEAARFRQLTKLIDMSFVN
jgi:hypothetical protein